MPAAKDGGAPGRGSASALHPLNPLPQAIRCPPACRQGWRRSRALRGNPLFIRSIRCQRQSAVRKDGGALPACRQSALHPFNPLPTAIRCPARPAAKDSGAPRALPGNPLFIRSIRCHRQSGLSALSCRQGWRRSRAMRGNPRFIRSIRCRGDPLSAARVPLRHGWGQACRQDSSAPGALLRRSALHRSILRRQSAVPAFVADRGQGSTGHVRQGAASSL